MSVRVLSWVFDHSPVEHRGDLLVLLVLADHAHDDGTRAFPSVETIARKARLSRRGAQLALRRLERVGAIKETASEGPRRPRSYSVIMGEPTSPRTDCTGEVADTEGRTESHVGAKGSSPEPSVEPSVEPSLPLSLKRSEGRERARSPVRSKEHRRAPEAVGMTERCSVCSMPLVHANGKLILPAASVSRARQFLRRNAATPAKFRCFPPRWKRFLPEWLKMAEKNVHSQR